MATELKAQDLVSSRLPDLTKGPASTLSHSTQNLEFKATLVHWTSFEKEVRREFLSIPWGTKTEVLAYAPPAQNSNPNHTYYEQLYCGDEHSVVARFGQNLSHVMTSVYQTLGIELRFGDFKACSKNTLGGTVPDIAVLSSAGHAKIIGEAKTPWMHDPQRAINKGQSSLRNYLGQISQYMYYSNLKYGFLTTYDQTIFLKQAPHPTKPNQWSLWHSRVIKHETSSKMVDPRSGSVVHRHQVSLRECFLFLGRRVAAGDFSVDNPIPILGWVGLPDRKYNDNDYISPSDDSSGSDESDSPITSSKEEAPPAGTRPRESRPHESAGGPSTRSHSRMMRELETRTELLGISSQSQQRQGSEPLITVILDQSSNRWFYANERGRRVFVELSEEEQLDGTRFFFMEGSRRRYVRRESRR